MPIPPGAPAPGSPPDGRRDREMAAFTGISGAQLNQAGTWRD
jgi:hypothetical protein